MNADKNTNTGRDGANARLTQPGRGNVGLLVLMGVGALLAAPGCGRGWVFDDTWRDSKTPPPFMLSEEKAIAFRVVPPDQQKAAQEMLTDIRYLRLTGEQATRFVESPLPQATSGRPYLIRGVCLFESGRFSVYHEEGVVVVNHGNMGLGTAWRVKRRVLVVWLESPPKKIIPRVSIAV